MNPPLNNAPLCWAPNRRVQNANSVDSAWEDVEEEEGSVTSALDTKVDASTGEEMEASGLSEALPKESHHAKGAYPGASKILRAQE